MKKENNCECARIKAVNGVWDYSNMIGATVKLKSLPISNMQQITDIESEYEIEDILFRISLDGKVITLVKLKGLSKSIFTFKDLEVTSVVNDRENEESK